MDRDDLKLLAEIAILGSNTAQTRDAQIIIEALQLTHQGEELAVTTLALNEYNQGKFDLAADRLIHWCDKHPAGVAHSLLAMVFWTWGKNADAERQCRFVLANADDQHAKQLALSIVEQMGVTI